MITKTLISDNSYLLEKELNYLKSINKVFVLNEPSLDDLFFEITEPPPVKKTYRFVFVRSLKNIKDADEKIIRTLEAKDTDQTVLYLCLPKLKKTTLHKYLADKPTKEIKPSANKKETREYIKKNSYNLDTQTFNLFYELVGNNPEYIDNELLKLNDFCYPAKIDYQTVQKYCYRYTKINPYKQVDEILLSSGGHRIAYVYEYEEQNGELYSLTNALFYTLKQILMIKDLKSKNMVDTAISNVLGIKPYIVDKNAKKGQNFKSKGLLEVTHKLGYLLLKYEINKLELIEIVRKL